MRPLPLIAVALVACVPPQPPPATRPLSPPPAAEPPAPSQPATLQLGSWNLEHFRTGAKRGFPEYTRGGPTYPARSEEDLAFMAQVVEELDLGLLLLQEIGAEDDRAPELERLVSALGDHWRYRLSASGGKQRQAILFDGDRVRLEAVCETDFSDEERNGKRVFARQGFYALATLKEGAVAKNDLVVWSVHLASGQRHSDNHDRAMEAFAERIAEAGDDPCLPAGERDVLIAGDFNANRFDDHEESFWEDMERGGWDVLADDPSYSATRLSGVPLGLGGSQIDYVIISDGLSDEIPQPTADVHVELLEGRSAEDFRRQASDHLPVTVQIAVREDDD